MLKLTKPLLLFLALSFCSVNANAQDVFISFSDSSISTTPGSFRDNGGPIGPTDVLGNTIIGEAGDTGTAFVFVRNGQDVFQLDSLEITSSNATIDSGELFQFDTLAGLGFNTRFTEPATATVGGANTTLTLFGTNFGALAGDGNPASTGIETTRFGQDEGSATFTDTSDGSTFDAFLLAQFDYSVLGGGDATFDFTGGGIFEPGAAATSVVGGANDVDYVGATITVEADVVPEPSSAMLLILGAAGMVARRRRS